MNLNILILLKLQKVTSTGNLNEHSQLLMNESHSFIMNSDSEKNFIELYNTLVIFSSLNKKSHSSNTVSYDVIDAANNINYYFEKIEELRNVFFACLRDTHNPYRNLNFIDNLNSFFKHKFYVNLTSLVQNKWCSELLNVAEVRKSTLVRPVLESLRILENFYKFKITDIKNTINPEKSINIYEYVLANFLDYLESFNEEYRSLTTTSVRYKKYYTYVDTINEKSLNRPTKNSLVLNLIFDCNSSYLFDMIPDLLNFKICDFNSAQNIEKMSLHCFAALLLTKSFFEINELFFIFSTPEFLPLLKLEILRYRLIFSLYWFNNPLLLSNSFVNFALLFFSYFDYFFPGRLSKDNMINIIENYVYPRFLKYIHDKSLNSTRDQSKQYKKVHSFFDEKMVDPLKSRLFAEIVEFFFRIPTNDIKNSSLRQKISQIQSEFYMHFKNKKASNVR